MNYQGEKYFKDSVTTVTLSGSTGRVVYPHFPEHFLLVAASNLKVVYMSWTGKQLVRLLEENGWILDRVQGSHHVMKKPGYRPVPVPVHANRDIQPHFAKDILKQAGLKEKF